jgi:gliding motility-associated-like protein
MIPKICLSKVLFSFLFFTSILNVNAQGSFTPNCDPTGNWILFANYDGGNLNIVVDLNIPNLKIGICTYEPVNVTFSGPFVNSVTEVLYAGFNSAQNNNNCGFAINTSSFTGINTSILTVNVAPPVTIISPPNPNYFNIPNGWNNGIICLYSCNVDANQGGCNTVDQVLAYFQSQFGGVLRGLNVQYPCWDSGTNYTVSAQTGNCCGACVPNAVTVSQTICNDQFPYSWNGLSITSAGSQSVTLTNAAGCDSVVTLDLAVSQNLIGTDIQSACGSFTWLDGNTYTSSTNTPVYTIVGGNVNGCDSIVNLNLTINQSSSSSIAVASCGPYFAPNGQTYTESSSFSYIIPNANGCDSTIAVNLTISPTPTAAFSSSPTLLEFGMTEIQMLDQSVGQISSWNWTYTTTNGSIQTSTLQKPIFTIPTNTSGNQTFQLAVSNAQGCTSEITSILNIVEDAALYIPNTFSPDGNAFNNVFKVAGRNIDLNQFELTIYNRWGEIIFISQDPNIGWDGAIANKGLAPIGTYTYQVVYRFVNASESETLTGHLNLIR